MAKYGGYVRGITPSLTDDNWTLEAQTAEVGEVIELSWGGQATTSTAMSTRVARGSGQAGSLTTGNVAKFNPASQTNTLIFGTTYATTQCTLDAGDLFSAAWNAHGGVVRWLAGPNEEIRLIGKATPDADSTLCCRNDVGTGTSNYGTVWEE